MNREQKDMHKKKSIRTTLKISEDALRALDILSDAYSTTIKGVLHDLIKRARESRSEKNDEYHNESSFFRLILKDLSENKLEGGVRKTHVMAQDSVDDINILLNDEFIREMKINKNELINSIITTYYSINCIEFFTTNHPYHQGKYIIDSIKPNVAILEELQLLNDFLAETHKKIESLTKKIPLIQSSTYDDGSDGIKERWHDIEYSIWSIRDQCFGFEKNYFKKFKDKTLREIKEESLKSKQLGARK